MNFIMQIIPTYKYFILTKPIHIINTRNSRNHGLKMTWVPTKGLLFYSRSKIHF